MIWYHTQSYTMALTMTFNDVVRYVLRVSFLQGEQPHDT